MSNSNPFDVYGATLIAELIHHDTDLINKLYKKKSGKYFVCNTYRGENHCHSISNIDAVIWQRQCIKINKNEGSVEYKEYITI